jgi:hypothetical protein
VQINAKLSGREFAALLEGCGASLCLASPKQAAAIADASEGEIVVTSARAQKLDRHDAGTRQHRRDPCRGGTEGRGWAPLITLRHDRRRPGGEGAARYRSWRHATDW